MEILAEFIVEVTAGNAGTQVDVCWRAERAAARKLADDGHLIRLWGRELSPPKKTALKMCVADTRQQLDRFMRTLPLHDWMQISVTDLLPQPNDPWDPLDARWGWCLQAHEFGPVQASITRNRTPQKEKAQAMSATVKIVPVGTYRRIKHIRRTLITGVIALLAVPCAAAARPAGQATGSCSQAQEVAAALNQGAFAALASVSCPSAGNCGAGGYYLDDSGG